MEVFRTTPEVFRTSLGPLPTEEVLGSGYPQGPRPVVYDHDHVSYDHPQLVYDHDQVVYDQVQMVHVHVFDQVFQNQYGK